MLRIENEMRNMTTEMFGSENFSFEKSKQFVVETKKFRIEICSFCNKEMELVEGSTIYGNKWYHGNCWNQVKQGGTKIDF